VDFTYCLKWASLLPKPVFLLCTLALQPPKSLEHYHTFAMDEPGISLLKDYVVREIGLSEDDTNSYLEVHRYNKCFYIHLTPGNLEGPTRITKEYLRYINAERRDSDPVKEEDSKDGSGFVDEDFYDWALESCSPLFEKLAPAPEPQLLKISLSDYYNAETFHYDLHAVNETLTLIIKPKVPGFSSPGVGVNRSTLHTSWPIYRPEEVLLNITNLSQALRLSPSVVTVGNTVQGNTMCYFKPFGIGELSRAIAKFTATRRLRR
jgi:hypothetical protein